MASLAADASARRLRGAALLDALHAQCSACMGDVAAHRLALRLLRAAAEPYFAMLARWLGEGEVDDPYGEFMVQEDAVSICCGQLWAEGWGQRLHALPSPSSWLLLLVAPWAVLGPALAHPCACLHTG